MAICTGCRVYGEMIPQPMAILFVSRAMMAVVAVEERASMECFRHQGYASANQKTSNPAASHACAMRTVSFSGSMLNCRMPILKGGLMNLDFSECSRRMKFQDAPSRRIGPGMLEAFNQLPHRSIERGGNARLFAPFDNRSVHEVHLGLPPRDYVLQHAGVVLAGSIGSFFDERARIAAEFNAECFRNRFALGDQFVEKGASGREARRRAVMQQ